MLDKKTCLHESFKADVDVQRFEDTGLFMADVRVRCVQCDEPFRFIGVAAGVRFDRPSVSIDGTELHAPIEPEVTCQLQTSATFQMPSVPIKH